MFNVNKKKLYTKITWRNLVKDMHNLKKYTIDFFYWVSNLGNDLMITYYMVERK